MPRPRVSTSAGQSVGGAVVTGLVLDADGVVAVGAFMDLARAEKAVLLEQARQLQRGVSCCRDQAMSSRGSTYGLPSGPRTTPGGKGFAGSVATAVAWPFACDSSRRVSSAMCAKML